jgi:hypothetical protein
MNKRMELVLIIIVISFLTSCSSIKKLNNFFTINNGIVLPQAPPGAVKTFTVDENGTVKIIGQQKITDTHWLYVKCDYWSGCYMRCQGIVDSCKKVASDSKIEVNYILSRSGWMR